MLSRSPRTPLSPGLNAGEAPFPPVHLVPTNGNGHSSQNGHSAQEDAPVDDSVAAAQEISAGPRADAQFQVAPEGAEELLAHAHLGKRIKQLRLKRSMGLVELGRRTGLSASFLSQLETGRVVPTLRNLARLALVFEKDLSFFFETTDRRVFRIQRRKDRIRLPHGGSQPDYISASFGILVPEGGLRPCMAELKPGAETRPFEPKSYPGIEMVYVLSGTVEVTRKGQVHQLRARDVMYISGETPRTYRSSGNDPAEMLIISFDSDSTESPRVRRRPSA